MSRRKIRYLRHEEPSRRGRMDLREILKDHKLATRAIERRQQKRSCDNFNPSRLGGLA